MFLFALLLSACGRAEADPATIAETRAGADLAPRNTNRVPVATPGRVDSPYDGRTSDLVLYTPVSGLRRAGPDAGHPNSMCARCHR